MSTGRRLAKRSIIGTKVCAPGPDGLWYSGVIQDVKAPPTATITSASQSSSLPSSSSSSSSSCSSTVAGDSGGSLHADTNYIVRFDFKTQTMQAAVTVATPSAGTSKSVIMEARRAANVHISPAQTLRRNAMIKEFRESDLIGPGFRSILGIQLLPGQRVFLTYNGRETSGDVVTHDADKDEVVVKITAIGTEEPIELKKRLEEVRLLESRRSARLADQDRDTDFARLADMGGDRRKTHSIEVPLSSLTPHHNNSRKRPPSYTHDCSRDQCDEEEMNECNAALILVNLSNSPKSPKNGEKWLGSSPGSSSSSASWSSGSSSPPLSDDGHATHTSVMLNDATASARNRTTSVSTSDEGIVVDFKEETPRKKKASKRKYKCTWKGCKIVELTSTQIERHIRNVHLTHKKARRSTDYDGSYIDSDHEEEFYYTEIEDDDDDGKTPSPTSPPTLSHRDMARPPHEDPEYQRQIVGNFKQGRAVNQQQQQYHSNNNGKAIHHINHSQQQQLQSNSHNSSSSNTSSMPTSPLAHHNYTWPSSSATAITAAIPATSTGSLANTVGPYQQQQQQQTQQHDSATFIKHARSSPRPSQSAAPYPSPTYVHHQHHNYSSSPSASSSSNSNNGCGSGSPVIHHSNSSANSVLQQLSQQNVTVTAHHSSGHQQQQQNTLSAITITPNYHPQHVGQQHMRGGSSGGHQQQSSAAATGSNGSALANPNSQHTVPHMAASQHNHHHPTQTHGGSVPHTAAAAKHTPNSPHRRTRGENKKCRKVYGMERKDQWCTQCRWKKACSRFND